MLAAFTLYGTHHIGTLVAILLITALLVYLCKKHPSLLITKSCLWILIGLSLASYPINQLALQATGGNHSLDATLPFHLCDITAVICGLALITRRPALCELAYFWGLAGATQGLLTPNIATTFPNPHFISFFILHGSITITALSLPLGLSWKPRLHAARRAFLWILAYAVGVSIINITLNTNFAYLMEKPQNSSLLDTMGPWPYYIPLFVATTAIAFYLLALPFKNQASTKH